MTVSKRTALAAAIWLAALLLALGTAATSATPLFGTKTDYVAGQAPQSVAIGDLNGDGKADLAVPNYVNTVAVLLAEATGPSSRRPTS